MDQLQKLRLKISTNTNLKFLCTASKDWTVEQLYPHITRLYKEVTADQGDKNCHIQINTLKKNGYFIPQSQVVGEIFIDNDEVTCTVDVDKATRKQQKKEEKIAEAKQESIEKEIEKLDKNETDKNTELKNEKSKTKNKKQKEIEKMNDNEIEEINEKKEKRDIEDKTAGKEGKSKSSKTQKTLKEPKVSKNPGDPKPVREKLNVDPEIIMSLIKLPKREESPKIKDVEHPFVDELAIEYRDKEKENEQNCRNAEENNE